MFEAFIESNITLGSNVDEFQWNCSMTEIPTWESMELENERLNNYFYLMANDSRFISIDSYRKVYFE